MGADTHMVHALRLWDLTVLCYAEMYGRTYPDFSICFLTLVVFWGVKDCV